MKPIFKWMLVLVAALIISSIATVIWFYQDYQHFLQQPLQISKQDQTYPIKKGVGMQSLALDLKQKGIISARQSWYVKYFSRLSDKKINLKIGRYQLPAQLTIIELFNIFEQGKTIQHAITLIEGSTLKEILQVIQHSKVLKHQLKAEMPLSSQLNIDIENFEGWFFPDTYYISEGTTDIQFLKRIHQNMVNILQTEWQNRAQNLPLKTAYEGLILASIIEKESAAKSERARISGVFIKRLMIGMRLQTDPTVIYGMGDKFDGNIRRKDLRRDTIYNTYTRKGLPPTPICMPSKAAIHAALHPNIDGSLYFVAKGRTGAHYFSKTLKEHNRAVRQYQLNK